MPHQENPNKGQGRNFETRGRIDVLEVQMGMIEQSALAQLSLVQLLKLHAEQTPTPERTEEIRELQTAYLALAKRNSERMLDYMSGVEAVSDRVVKMTFGIRATAVTEDIQAATEIYGEVENRIKDL